MGHYLLTLFVQHKSSVVVIVNGLDYNGGSGGVTPGSTMSAFLDSCKNILVLFVWCFDHMGRPGKGVKGFPLYLGRSLTCKGDSAKIFTSIH